jgi:uncharacterized phage protein gp47/JayE
MTVPTFQELYNSVLTDLRNKLQTTTIIGKIALNAFAAVQAAKLKIFYLTINNVEQNIFIDTADDDTIIRYGLVKLGRLPNAATAGQYNLNVIGEIGAVIAPGTTFKSLDSSSNPGVIVQLDTAYTFTSTSGVILVRALELGAAFALQTGDQLQLTAPIASVDSFADVDSIQVTPTEAEDIEQYRKLVIEAYRSEPQGGARIDYRIWTNDVSGTRTVYPYVKSGESGVIDLFIEANAVDSVDGNGTPSASLIQDVEDAIEPDKRPMGTFQINYLAVVTIDVDVQITNLSDPTFLTAIESSIRDFLLDIRPFIDGADNVNDRNDKLFESDIYNIVRDVIGLNATFDSLEMFVDAVSVDVFTFDQGNIPYINSVAII